MIPVLSQSASRRRKVISEGGGGGTYASLITGHAALVAYWRLGESSGTTAVDEKGSHNGTYNYIPSLGHTSLINGDSDTSAAFDGGNARVNVPYASWMNLTTDFTLECWIKFNSFTNDNTPFSRGYSGSISYLVDHNDASSPGKMRMGSYPLSIVPGATTLSAGVKYHVMAVFGSTNWTLYLNGAADMTMSSPGSVPTDTTDFGIGYMPVLGRTVDAIMDEVAIYSAALTATDAANHYAAGA